MNLESFAWHPDQGWSMPDMPKSDSDQTVVVAFGASELIEKSEPIQRLAAAFPASHMIGCSSSGEIFGSEVRDGTLAVAVARMEKTRLARAFVPIEKAEGSYAAGERLGKELLREGLKGVLVLSDGIHVNGTELVRGLNSVLPPTVVVTGGLAGDGDRFKKTWILEGGMPRSHGISAVGFYGDAVRISHGSKGGWDIFGPERTITRSEGNVLYELDNTPALALYKKYLGERASGLPATGLLFPLALRSAETDSKILVRTILAVDEAKQSMTFAGDIPQGGRAQFMRANLDRLVDGASEAARMAQMDSLEPETPKLSIAISCIGRRLVLGERTEEETEAVLESLPPGTQQVGFYSYGEISPYTTGACDLHNQTMTLTVIAEA